MKPGRVVVVFFISVIALGLLPFSIRENEVASALNGDGYYEADIPLKGTYLQSPAYLLGSYHDGRYDEAPLVDPLIVNLAANGFLPGDKIMISYKTSLYDTWGYDPYWNLWGYVYGLFSNSSTLISQRFLKDNTYPWVGPVNRVPGAIDAALGGYQHKAEDNTNTFVELSDIPQDFRVYGDSAFYNYKGAGAFEPWTADSYQFCNGFWVAIPPNAKFLFLTAMHYNYGRGQLGGLSYCRVTIDKDTDGDALPDSWEKNGIDFDKDGFVDLTLTGAYYLQKDIYVEIDYMAGHRPNEAALDDVAAAFRNCPSTVDYGPINLHAEIDDSDAGIGGHFDIFQMWKSFDSLKAMYWGTKAQRDQRYTLAARCYVYHYCLFIHGYSQYNGTDWVYTGSSGLALVNGNDFLVSLGTFTDGVGTREEQAGTFMHELGHNLGLRHGGDVDLPNYKPNYLSIMNYLFQFPDVLRYRPLTYSNAKLASLDEADLNETAGVKDANWDWTVYSGVLERPSGTSYVPLAVSTLGKIDWDNDGDETETSVSANVNNYPKWKYYSKESEVLEGFDDWSNLNFYSYENKTLAKFFYSVPGVHDLADAGGEELSWDTVTAMREDAASMAGGPTGPVQIIPELSPRIMLPALMIITLAGTVLQKKRER